MIWIQKHYNELKNHHDKIQFNAPIMFEIKADFFLCTESHIDFFFEKAQQNSKAFEQIVSFNRLHEATIEEQKNKKN